MKRLMTGISLGLLLLCSSAGAREKEIVFLGRDMHFRLNSFALGPGEIPYSRMDCPTTKSCFVTYHACEPVELVKQDQAKTVIRVDWMTPSKLSISGNIVEITFKDAETCNRYLAVSGGK